MKETVGSSYGFMVKVGHTDEYNNHLGSYGISKRELFTLFGIYLFINHPYSQSQSHQKDNILFISIILFAFYVSASNICMYLTIIFLVMMYLVFLCFYVT